MAADRTRLVQASTWARDAVMMRCSTCAFTGIAEALPQEGQKQLLKALTPLFDALLASLFDESLSGGHEQQVMRVRKSSSKPP